MRREGPYRTAPTPIRPREAPAPRVDREALAVLAITLLTVSPPVLDWAVRGRPSDTASAALCLLGAIALLFVDTLRGAVGRGGRRRARRRDIGDAAREGSA